MREYFDIIVRNVVTPIFIMIAVLVGALLALGETRDGIFLSVVIGVNTVIGVVQETRAHRALKKLEILNAPRARKRRSNGSFEEVSVEQLALHDVIRVEAGDQLPADATVLESHGLECDESLLTGEATTVPKPKNAEIHAGSFAMAGSAVCQVTALGAETKAGEMTATLQRYRPQLTPLQKSIMRAISLLSFVALFLVGLIWAVYTTRGYDTITILKAITTSAVTVVPEGLLLASTLLLALGSLNLARHKVLPQNPSAIEAMALLDILCVDKTGTLTSNELKLEEIRVFKAGENGTSDNGKRGATQKNNAAAPSDLRSLLAVLAHETSSGSSTGQMLQEVLSKPPAYTTEDIMAFSSARKMSAVRFRFQRAAEKGGGQPKLGPSYAIFMGAPEILAAYAPLTKEQQTVIAGYTAKGLRVLLVASFDDHQTPLAQLYKKQKGKPVGVVIISNELRKDVARTIDFLQHRGVSIRVISGDNAETVQSVAREAGISAADKVITGPQLAALSDDLWDETVIGTTIFARVLPEQKERLAATFQKYGKFTGMVGDGVNDALALKKADLGVAMYAGASASRRVADIVLLDNSFTSLPIGMRLGNKIMQSLELIASLFFHKITYDITLLLTTLAIGQVYPFLPRHVTFLNIFFVTIPVVLWTAFPPEARSRVDPRAFWRRTLGRMVPLGVITGITLAAVYWLLLQWYPNMVDRPLVRTVTAVGATLVGMVIVYVMPRVFAVPATRRTMHMRTLYTVSTALIAGGTFAWTWSRNFFDFVLPPARALWALALVAVAIGLQFGLVTHYYRQEKRAQIQARKTEVN